MLVFIVIFLISGGTSLHIAVVLKLKRCTAEKVP